MASGTANPSPSTAKSPDEHLVEYEIYIDQQLRRTRGNVKAVDISSSLMSLAAVSLIFLLVSALADHWIVSGGLGLGSRWFLLLLLLAGATVYLVRRLVPLIVRPINALYAAQSIERSAPSLKNSLLNFLLFRRAPEGVSRGVYEVLEEQAATRLAHAGAESAVDRTGLLRIGYLLLAVAAISALYKVLSPKDPFVSAARVLMPWSDIQAPSRVSIQRVDPGHTTVAEGEHVTVSADIHGVRTDDPIQVVYSMAGEQIVDRGLAMSRSADGFHYSCKFPESSTGIRQGFHYRIEAGDARSATYHVRVTAAPTIVVESVDYDYPPYTGLSNRHGVLEGDIQAIENTHVTLHARSNQPIQSAHVDFDSDGRRDQTLKWNGQQANAEFTLALRDDRRTPQHTSFQLRFTNDANQENRDPVQYRIVVTPDLAPEIELLTPRDAEIPVPLDSAVDLEIHARDPDFALRLVELHARANERTLFEKRLLDEEHSGALLGKYRFAPQQHGLQAGDVVECWGVAHDNKSPDANVRESARKRLRIIPPNQEQGRPQNQNRNEQKEQQPEQDEQEGQQDGKQQTQGEQDGKKDTQQPEQDEQEGQQDGKQQTQGEQDGKKDTQQPEQDEQEGQQNGKQQQQGEQDGKKDTQQPEQDEQEGQQNGKQQQQGEQDGKKDTQQREKDEQQRQQDGKQQGQASQKNGAKGQKESSTGDSPSQDEPAAGGSGGSEEKREVAKDGSDDGSVFEEVMKRIGLPHPSDAQPSSEEPAPDGRGASGEKRPAGAGSEKEPQGAPEPQTELRERNKTHESGNDKTPRDADRARSPAHGKSESDSRGPQQGDKAGGGKEGGGQQSDQKGSGTAGQNSAADEGGGAAAEVGNSEESQRGGQGARSDKPTGKPSAGDSGPGSREKSNGSADGKPDGAQGQDTQSAEGGSRGDPAAQKDGSRSDPATQGDGSRSEPGREAAERNGEGARGSTGGGGQAGANQTQAEPGELAPEGDAANVEYARQATELVLDHLKDQLAKDNVNRGLLEQLGWTRDDLQRFVSRWQTLRDAAKAPGDKGQDGRRELENVLRSLGLRKDQLFRRSGSMDDQMRKLRESLRTTPPREYQERLRAYNKGTAKAASN